MNAVRVLIVDDEPQARRLLRTALIGHGFEVTDVASGEQAIENLREALPDVILLDLKMPGIGGIETCRLVRANSDIPIIVVSVTQTSRRKVEALEAGADDYVTKPFEIEELVARIQAVKRRASSMRSHILTLGDVHINLHSRDVRRPGAASHLTDKEFKLLDYLISHAGEVISHRRLLQAVWGPDYGDELEYLRVCISQLRKKVEPDPEHPKYVLTELHAGYRFLHPLATATV